MTRDPDPRTAGNRLLSTRGATAAGWALLAAVGVGGLMTTAPVATGHAGHGEGQGHGGTATADGALFVGPTTQDVGAAVPTVATAPAMITMAAAPSPLAFRTSAYATGNPDGRAAVAIRTAMAQIGLPYVWGGNGPTNGDAGFDCSGLTHYAYGVAGIALPRTAHTQFYAGPRVPSGAPLQPGDLVFYGTLARVHHVGMYIGDGRMVNAPTFGQPVQVAYYRWAGDDFVGATRPAATSTGDSSALPFIPETVPTPAPAQPGESDVFVAPPAPLPTTLPAPGQAQVPEAQSAADALNEQQKSGTSPLTSTTTPTPTPSGTALAGTTGPTTTGTPAAPPPAGTPSPSTSNSGPTTSSAASSSPTSATVPQTLPQTGPQTGPQTSAPTTPPTVPTTPAVPTTPSAPVTTTTPPTSAASSTASSRPATSTPAPVTTTSVRPSPAPRSTITFSAVAPVPLVTTTIGATGLPVRAGVVARPARPVVRLVVAPSVVIGATVTLKLGAAAPVTYTIASSKTLTAAAAAAVVAAAPVGELVVLVPTASGTWTVVTAI